MGYLARLQRESYFIWLQLGEDRQGYWGVASVIQCVYSQRSLSLFVRIKVVLLEGWWDALHDLLSLGLVLNSVGVEVAWGAQLKLGFLRLLALLDGDLLSLWEVALLPSHHLDKFFKIFDFLWLMEKKKDCEKTIQNCKITSIVFHFERKRAEEHSD